MHISTRHSYMLTIKCSYILKIHQLFISDENLKAYLNSLSKVRYNLRILYLP